MSGGAPLIAHVVYRFAVGGLENGVVNLVNRLPADAWRHVIISLTDIDDGFARRVTRSDVEMIALHKRPGHAFPLYPRLYRQFKALDPAIVHTRNLAALEATVPAWAAGVPVRVHGEHGRDAADPEGTNARRQWIRRAFRPFVTRYVALSPDLERYLARRVGVPGDRIEQIFNGVDTSRFRPSASRVPIAGCPFTDPRLWLIGTVGRLDTVKDQGNLAAAFVHAITLHPAARERMRLVIVGEGELRSDIEAILEAANVRDLAWLAGERGDVHSVLQGLDAFALPSLAEGVSNTILEAMSTGVPIVATRVGANAELLGDGSSGTIVPPADSEALAAALLRYFEHAELARAHGRAARKRVESVFSLERMLDRYHRLYSDLVDDRRTALATPTGGPASRPLRH